MHVWCAYSNYCAYTYSAFLDLFNVVVCMFSFHGYLIMYICLYVLPYLIITCLFYLLEFMLFDSLIISNKLMFYWFYVVEAKVCGKCAKWSANCHPTCTYIFVSHTIVCKRAGTAL